MLEKKNAPVGTCNLLLVLGMLEDGERAGHEIITALERQCDRTFSGQEGAIYPLLHQLEERGDIRSRERTDGGRPRRVYRLTRQDTKTLARCRREWERYRLKCGSLAAGGEACARRK